MDDLGDLGPQARWRVHLCQGPNCTLRGANELMPVLREAVERAGLGPADVEIIAATCRDRCGFGPAMNVYPGPTFYNGLTPGRIERIVGEHLAGGAPVREFTKLVQPVPEQRTGRSGRDGGTR